MEIRTELEESQQLKKPQVDLGLTTTAQEIADQKELWDSSALPQTERDFDMHDPGQPVEPLLLKSNVPSTIWLQGAPDLSFSGFVIQITAHSVQRNMAKEWWGAASSVSADGIGEDESSDVFRFPGVTSIDLIAVKGSQLDGTLNAAPETNGRLGTVVSLNRFLKTSDGKVGYQKTALRTDALRVSKLMPGASYLFRSSSLPSRVGIAIGDDSPLQMFATEMADGGTVVSRDLAGQLNAAWRQAKAAQPAQSAKSAKAEKGAESEHVRIPLKLTSLTDGEVTVAFRGAWGRSWQREAPLSDKLNAVRPVTLAADWPFEELSASVALRLAGKLSGGIRQRLVPAARQDELPFAIRVGEKLEIAQAVLLARGSAAVKAREVSAVWLLLPALPLAEQKVELRLAKAAGSPPVPSDDPIARIIAVLPVDASAYIQEGNRFWYRAVFDTPVNLDGAQMVQPLFVMAAGRGEGTLLGHQRADAQAEAGETDWIPAGEFKAGPALIRNLGRSRAWEAQAFNRQRSQWSMDLELVPLAEEYGQAVSAAVVHQPGQEQQAGFAGPGAAASINWDSIAAPPDRKLAFVLQSAIAANLTAQIILYHAVKKLDDDAADAPVKKGQRKSK